PYKGGSPDTSPDYLNGHSSPAQRRSVGEAGDSSAERSAYGRGSRLLPLRLLVGVALVAERRVPAAMVPLFTRAPAILADGVAASLRVMDERPHLLANVLGDVLRD